MKKIFYLLAMITTLNLFSCNGLDLFITKVFARKIETYYYKTLANDKKLKHILEKKLGIPKNVLYGKEHFYKKVQGWNPSIKDWNNLSLNTRIYLEFPRGSFHLQSQTKIVATNKNLKKTKTKNKKAKEIVKKGRYKRWGANIFYSASRGNFSESVNSNNTNGKVKTVQLSPLTIGVMGTYRFSKRQAVDSSLYWSKLNPFIESNTSRSISAPGEIGFNLYSNYQFKHLPFITYGGLDLEFFNTFDGEAILNQSNFSYSRNQMTFFTLGISKIYPFKQKQFLLLKLSYSYSFLSSVTHNSGETGEALSGSKFILFGSYISTSKWSVSIFYKEHNLHGKNSLRIQRTGLGVGYSLF